MDTIHINLAGTQLSLRTNFPGYYNYLSNYFGKIKSSERSPAPIEINFEWSDESLNECMGKIKRSGDFSRIGANTFLADRQVMTVRKLERKWKVLFHAVQDGDRLKLTANFPRKPFKDVFRFSKFNRRADEFFFMITYYVLYYPLFWFLEKKNTHALHASALVYDQKGVVICGLEGIGKTSLGLMFLKEAGSRFLSDNLVFYNNTNVYPCYELIRMHATDDGIWKEHFEKMNSFDLLKGFFSPKFNVQQGGIKVDYFIFPEFSDQFEVTKITSDEAVARAVALSHLPSELNHYSEYRHLFNLLDLKSRPWGSVYHALEELLQKSQCYRVGMPKDDGLEKNFQRLKKAVFNEK